MMFTMAASAQGGGSLWWGYCHEAQVPDNYLGVSKVAVYEAAIHVDGSDQVAGGTSIEAVRLPFGSVEHVDSLTLWLTTSLDSDERLLTLPVEAPAAGWNVVTLAEPLAIPAEGLYVGYTFKVTELDGQSERPLVMCNDLNDGGLWLRVAQVKQYRDWYNTRRYGSLALQLQLTGGSLQAHNADLDAIRSNNVVRCTDDSIEVMFTNRGTEPLTSLQYTYAFGDQTQTGSCELPEAVPNVYGAVAYATVPVKAPEATGRMPLTLTLTGLNGADNASTANTSTCDVVSLSRMTHRRTVMEEYTGTWCSACPRGFAGIARLKRMFPDDFIAISVHVLNGDPMDVYYDYYYVMNATQFPSCRFDRGELTDPYDGDLSDGHFHADQNFLAAHNILAPADLSVEAQWTGDSVCSIKSTVDFAFDAADCDYTLAYVMTEDSLRGPEGDHSWHQKNSFSDPVMAYYVEDDMQQYVNATGTMIDDVAYNDVVTAMSDVRGISGSLQGPQQAGQPMTHTYELSLPAISQHRENIHVVALLIDTTTRRIANAAQCTPAPDPASVPSVAQIENGKLNIEVYDLQGRRILNSKSSIFNSQSSIQRKGLTIEQRPDGSIRKIIQ